MTKRDFRKECNRISKIWKTWQPILGLSEWDVKLHFYTDVDEEDPDVEAWAHASWEYIRADLHFIIPKTLGQTDSELEEIVVHEACHVLVKELQDWSTCDCDKFDMKKEERVVTHMCRAFIRAHSKK